MKVAPHRGRIFFDRERRAYDVELAEMLKGGIINSRHAAQAFGEMVLASERPDQVSSMLPFSVEEIDGLRHIVGRRDTSANDGRFEMIFKRRNAQIVEVRFP